jgi:transposase
MSPMMIDLTLPGYRTIRVERNLVEVRFYLEAQSRPQACLCCGGDRLRSKGRYERVVRHLDCCGRICWLYVACRRWRCCDCERSFVQALPGIVRRRHSTESWREEMFRRHDDGICASRLARRERLGEATVGRIYAQFTARKAKERLSLNCPQFLGIDEHTLHKGQRFATTFCDLKKHRIFDLSPGRSEPELAGYLSTLRGRKRVRMVCIDLSNAYRLLVHRWFPAAKIVADRFHAVRLVGLHLMRVARQLCPELGWHRAWLGLLRRRSHRLDPAQRHDLQKLFALHPALQGVYELKERLFTLLCRKKQNPDQCRRNARELFELIATLRTSGLEAAGTLGKTLSEWTEEIACMWRFTRNNAITEGFHRKMKLIQRRAYGFRSFQNYRLRVIAQCG